MPGVTRTTKYAVSVTPMELVAALKMANPSCVAIQALNPRAADMKFEMTAAGHLTISYDKSDHLG